MFAVPPKFLLLGVLNFTKCKLIEFLMFFYFLSWLEGDSYILFINIRPSLINVSGLSYKYLICLQSITFGLKMLNLSFSSCLQFVKVIYNQLKFGLQENKKVIDVERKSASVLFDEYWLSADSFMYHMCKVFMIWLN